MKIVRRQLLRLIAGVAVLPIFSRVASALDYPSQPVRLIVPYAPGGTTDTVARQIGPWLSERLAQVIESRPGAGTNVGPMRSHTQRPTKIRSSCLIRLLQSTPHSMKN